VFSICIGLLIKGRLDNTEVSIQYGQSMQKNWQHRVHKTKKIMFPFMINQIVCYNDLLSCQKVLDFFYLGVYIIVSTSSCA
jgi:hypothetical protein